LDDLPYDPIEYLPHIYGKFREKSAGVQVRPLLPTPEKNSMPFPSLTDSILKTGVKYIPTL